MQKEIYVPEKSLCYIDTPIGRIGITEDGKGISDLFFSEQHNNVAGKEQDTPLLQSASAQLNEYFNGKRWDFDLPLSLKGTAFQLAVWNALLTIPYGQTRSYKDIAEQISSPRAYRAVGMANNRNPVSIIVPCHRVVGSDGSLVGYGGGIQVKEFLLRLEQRHVVYQAMHITENAPQEAESLDDVQKDTW